MSPNGRLFELYGISYDKYADDIQLYTAMTANRKKLRHADKPSTIKVAVLEKLKTLGDTLDSALTFEDHINGVVRSCNFHIRALRRIRRHLTRDVANTVAGSIVGARFDDCNSLLYGAS